MIFTELRFFAFLAIVFCVYWSLSGHQSRKVWLLACSYVFYGAWDWRFTALIALSTVIDFFLGKWIAMSQSEQQRKLLLICSVVVNLGILGFFKYYNFFADSFFDLMEFSGVSVSRSMLEIILPVGISFYTFQTLSYTIDVWRRKLPPAASFLDFSLFVAFFPQLVAGPIVRASDFLPQMTSEKRWGEVPVRFMLSLFLVGYIKKSCISDNISPYIDAYFQFPDEFDAMSCHLAMTLYAIQIYCDFSGYSDMAIAVAGLLGYHLPINFRAPYFSFSVTEFWQRWHISLSTWLRDYLYIPLGGNRKGAFCTYVNLMTTMVLGGLWHGASWNFVVWGLIHGTALVVDRLIGGIKPQGDALPAVIWVNRILGLGLTWFIVTFAWILFRAPDFPTFLKVAEVWLFLGRGGDLQLNVFLWVHVLGFALVHLLFYRIDLGKLSSRVPIERFAFLYGIAFAVIFALTNTSYRPFIYFQF